MNRSKFGSLLFLGGTLLFMMGPSADGEASAQPVAEGPQQSVAPAPAAAPKAPVPASLPVSTEPGPGALAAAATPKGLAPLAAGGSCPAGMVEVEGDYCPRVAQKCVRWIDPANKFPRRCAEYAPTVTCEGKTVKKHFCIDQFEYPNRAGEKPVVMRTWYDARDACKAQGKRLCGDSEWTLACEGQERLPYPYGYERSAEACNIDKPHPDVNEKALANPLTRDAEVARLWQGEPSGTRESCVSPFGVHDMTGNVDEWVVNESGMPYQSGLKGGYWGPVRDRCRPMTTAHYESFAFYQIGFRCCSDVPEDGASPSAAPGASPAGKASPSTNRAPSELAGS